MPQLGLDVDSFRKWENSLPVAGQHRKGRSKLFLAPTLPCFSQSPEASIYSDLLAESPVEEEFRWWEDAAFRSLQTKREETAISAAKAEVESLLQSLEGALQAEKARELEAQRAARAKEEEATAKVQATQAAATVTVAVPTPRPAAATPEGGLLGALAASSAELAAWGSELRKTSPPVKELWKETALATATIAGNKTSVKSATEKLLDIMNRAKNVDVRTSSWLGLIVADKLLGTASVHNKSGTVWAAAYVVRLVGSAFPDFPGTQLVGCLARKSPWVLAHTDSYLRLSLSVLTSDQSCKDCEAQTRLWLAVLAVAGDARGLGSWLNAIVSRAKTNEVVLSTIATALKLFVFVDTAAYDLLRLAKQEAQQMLSEVHTLLTHMKTLPNKNATFTYYVDAALNVFAGAGRQWPVPEGLSLSASRETDLNPDM